MKIHSETREKTCGAFFGRFRGATLEEVRNDQAFRRAGRPRKVRVGSLLQNNYCCRVCACKIEMMEITNNKSGLKLNQEFCSIFKGERLDSHFEAT